jgi:hypothetical protein
VPDHDLRSVMRSAVRRPLSGLALASAVHAASRRGRAAMAAAGNEIAVMSEALTEEIRARGAEVTQDWIEQVTQRGLDGAGLVAAARAAVAAERGSAPGPYSDE